MSDASVSKATRLTIFWPDKLTGSGCLYGFISDNGGCVCVVACVAAEVAVTTQQSHEDVLTSLTIPSGSTLAQIEDDCGKLCIVGTLNADTPREDDSLLRFMREGSSLPTLRGPSRSVIFVLYEPPNTQKFRFLSLRSIPLDVTEYRSEAMAALSVTQTSLSQKASQMLASDVARKPIACVDLPNSLKQINCSHEISKTLSSRPAHTLQTPGARAPRSASWAYLPTNAVLGLLSTRLYGKAALRDVSATAHQIDLRLRQGQLSVLALRASRNVRISEPSMARAQYISFYGTLWLIANDVIIGTSLMTFLCENDFLLADGFMRIIKVQTISNLQWLLLWLNDWPGGIKLNDELGGFFCDAFLWFTAAWETHFLDVVVAPHLPTILRSIGYSALLGSTLSLSLLSDLVAMSTLHLYTFYLMATTLFRFHTSAMASLSRIFRGKKRNVEKNRLEPTEYRLDQLLLGSILFTIAIFLFPTVLAYYLVFASCRLLSIGINASFEALLVFLNHFPLFAFMLRLKDPARLPGGVRFDVVSARGQLTYLKMSSKPVPISAIFHQYIELWRSFSRHYSPLQLLTKLLKGEYIRVISRSKLAYIDLTHREPGE